MPSHRLCETLQMNLNVSCRNVCSICGPINKRFCHFLLIHFWSVSASPGKKNLKVKMWGGNPQTVIKWIPWIIKRRGFVVRSKSWDSKLWRKIGFSLLDLSSRICFYFLTVLDFIFSCPVLLLWWRRAGLCRRLAANTRTNTNAFIPLQCTAVCELTSVLQCPTGAGFTSDDVGFTEK